MQCSVCGSCFCSLLAFLEHPPPFHSCERAATRSPLGTARLLPIAELKYLSSSNPTLSFQLVHLTLLTLTSTDLRRSFYSCESSADHQKHYRPLLHSFLTLLFLLFCYPLCTRTRTQACSRIRIIPNLFSLQRSLSYIHTSGNQIIPNTFHKCYYSALHSPLFGISFTPMRRHLHGSK